MPSKKKINTNVYAVATVLTGVGKDKSWGLTMNEFHARNPEEAIGMAMIKWSKNFPNNGFACAPMAMKIN